MMNFETGVSFVIVLSVRELKCTSVTVAKMKHSFIELIVYVQYALLSCKVTGICSKLQNQGNDLLQQNGLSFSHMRWLLIIVDGRWGSLHRAFCYP